MKIPDTIRTYLINQGITNAIYVGFLPAEPDTAVCITPTAGLAPDAKHSYNSAGIQIRTRANEYLTAETLAHTIFDYLQSAALITISGTFIVDIQAQQDPFSLGRDEQNRHGFAQNFLLEYYNDLGWRE